MTLHIHTHRTSRQSFLILLIAVVIGGGLLGLECAKALRDMGLHTHVVEFAPQLMPAQLDKEGGATLQRTIEDMGIGVWEMTVGAMRETGARDIRAVIGPTISLRAYEVGEEFMDRFLAEAPESGRFFSGGPNGRPMFDLPALGVARLRDLGVEAEWSGHCTYSDPERFFSYRRATHEGAADYGRLISAIRL